MQEVKLSLREDGVRRIPPLDIRQRIVVRPTIQDQLFLFMRNRNFSVSSSFVWGFVLAAVFCHPPPLSSQLLNCWAGLAGALPGAGLCGEASDPGAPAGPRLPQLGGRAPRCGGLALALRCAEAVWAPADFPTGKHLVVLYLHHPRG